MAANLPKAKRVELMRRAWSLAVEGRPQSEIAAALAISQSQVSRYLAALARRASASLDEEVATYLILTQRQNDEMFWKALQAFDRSTRPKKRATKKTTATTATTPSDDGTPRVVPSDGTTTTEVIEREGDTAWLDQARHSLRLRLEILDRLSPKADPKDKPAGSAATVADALLEAEARDAAYQTPTEETTDAG